MPSASIDFRSRCGAFLFVFIAFMSKRAKKRIAMRQKTLRVRTLAGGVTIGLILTLLFWGDFLLRCGDVEQNPGPPKSLRQSSLTSRRDSMDKEKAASASSTSSTPGSSSPAATPSLLDVVSMLQDMRVKFDQMDSKFGQMDSKFDQMKEDIKDIRDGYSALQEEMRTMKEEVADLRRENDSLRISNEDLKRRMEDVERKTDDLEGRSKRNNLIFYGLSRRENETPSDCEGMLHDLIVDKMELSGDFQFDRVHRINSKPDSPIIARCVFFKEKEQILKAKHKLRGNQVFVGEDFSLRVREMRRKLVPHLKKARGEGKRATLVYDHLLIEGKRFGLDDKMNLREIL